MKTIKFQLLLLALFVMVGCQQDEISTSIKKGSYSLVASIENNDSTSRTAVDENGGVTWIATDAIGVFGMQTKNAKFESTGAGANVTFVGELASSHEEPTLAYYPYNENASLDGNALSFTLPSEYTYTGQSYAPMLGIKQENGNFSFKHLVGLLKVTVKNMPENAKRLFVVSEGAEEKAAPAITGDVLVSDVTASNATLSITENKGHEVSIDLKNTSAQETYTFYIPVPVGEYPKLSVNIEIDNGIVGIKKSVSNVDMKRAMLLDMALVDIVDETISAKEVVVSVDMDNISGLNVSSFIDETLLDNNNCSVDVITNGLPQFVFVSENENILMLSRGYFEDDNNVINAKSTALALVTMQPAFVLGEKEHFDMLKNKVMQSSNFPLLKSEVEKEIKARKDIFLTENTNIPILINKIIEDVYGVSSVSRSLKGDIIPCLNNDPEPEPLTVRVDKDKVYIYNKDLYPAYECQVYRGGSQVIPSEVIAPTSNYYGILDWLNGLDGENIHWGEPKEFSLSERGEYLFFCDMKTPNALLSTALPIIADIISTIGFGKLNIWKNEKNKLNFIYNQIGWNQVKHAGWGSVFWVKVFQDLVPGVIVVLTDPYLTLKEKTKRIGQNIFKYLMQEVPVSIAATYKTEVIKGETFVMYSEPKAWRKFVSNCFKLYNIGISGVNVLHRIWAYDQCKENMPSVEFKLCKYNEITCCTKFILDKKESTDNQIGLPYAKLKEPLTVGVKTEDGCDVKLDSYQKIKFEVVSGYGIVENQKNENKGAFVISSIDWKLGYSGEQKVKVVVYDEKLNMELSEPVYFTAYFEPEEEGTITTTEATNKTQTTATLSGNIQGYEADDFGHRYGIIYSTDANPTASNGTIVYSNNIQEDGNYSVNVVSLTENTTYYYRAFVIKGGEYVYGNIMNFTTLKPVEDNEGMTEREILIAFYNATDGDNWTNNENWCSDKPLGEWHGITTDGDGYVTSIYLSGELVIETKESRKFGLKGNANLSNLSKLEDLYLEHNELTSLTVENCPNLYRLLCSYNALTEVNVDGVGYLSLDNNQLTSLDFSDSNKFAKLIYLQADNNQLSMINLSACSNLSELSVSENKLTSLDVSSSKALNRLSCDRNQLTNLNVTGCNELAFLQCYNNQLTTINLKGLVNLTRVDCRINKLKSLDLSGLNKITYLELRENELTELDVSDLVELKGISCNKNKLTNLKMHEGIISLDCSYNNFIELDLSDYTNLESFISMGNSIQKLNFEGCSKFASIQLDNMVPIESLNLIGCTSFGSRGLLLFNTLFMDIHLPSSLSKYKNNFKVWGDWIESENRYQYPNFHWK